MEQMQQKSASDFFDAWLEEKNMKYEKRLLRLLETLDFASQAFHPVSRVAKFLNRSPQEVRDMIDNFTIKALKKGDTCEHWTVFTDSVLEYVESLKSPDFEYDKYFRNEQGARMRGKAGLIRECERLGINTKKKVV